MTLAEALALAVTHWEHRSGGKVMVSTATRACTALGLTKDIHKLTPSDGVSLLASLRAMGLSPKSAADYYATFRRVLALSGVTTSHWPKAPTPPRRTRDDLTEDHTSAVIVWLRARGWQDTGDLAVLLRGTGLRVRIEGLSRTALKFDAPSPERAYGLLHVTGKGGHERVVPVVDPECITLLGDAGRLDAIRSGAVYETHLRRWNEGIAALGVQSRLATFHALRHGYASQALRHSGGNLAMVQMLLGHSDINTTARYLHVPTAEAAQALSQGSAASTPEKLS